ncbi:hypothetical protein RRG08_056555 [Elysia crispata]|uniref:Uncharacterized protein n=1 Tax=Elysia crispata TaxID=231223 RepID=A0AAE0YDN8_9GAST|nr:hypothetical protein RRG08_056555 [Elysia crispata]
MTVVGIRMCTSILLGVSIPCKDDSRWYQNVYQYTAGRVHTMMTVVGIRMCTSILLGVSIPCKDDSRWYQNVYQYSAGRVHTM